LTTIAWDGKTLAGDKQTTIGDTPVPTTKVFRLGTKNKRVLVGACGNKADCQAFVTWVKNGFGGQPEFTDFTGMVIDLNGNISLYDENPNTATFSRDKWAIGSGANFALGAMAHGATAAESVAIASELDIYSGLGIDTVDFS
jgi:ATP-dependent protease HslVU (ClpYQ) peptidase subunit